MDWLPSVPTDLVLVKYLQLTYPNIRIYLNNSTPNLIFYPISQNCKLSENQPPFTKCINPASSIPVAIQNFQIQSEGTPDSRALDFISSVRHREAWNSSVDFREDQLLYCYSSIFRSKQELTWDGWVDQLWSEKKIFLEQQRIPYIGYTVEII
ncbi:hypothetical protein SS50377_23603 [Spironucleus salmonicida]|uniref:Uncharacterized protein n=1 Tax=Spironucleus salmonicida TaxID=348837 RepID=V6LVG1_9EUKA|nr:hypothetical protein SS50377_23603 [Spironucleus salmonicida]|eukprot:EST48585.1 Hypothetical protein SS50377_11196 [Spironucleus salmonicida]